MELGITTPVVTAFPGACSPWELAAGPDELRRVAVAADELGFAHLTCSEHVAVPVDVAAQRGGTYWDPVATLAWFAAHTSRIQLLTQVLVLGYHHPLEIAKRFGTIDVLSGGRVVLGLGVGSLEEEFTLLEATFAGRGDDADDSLRALRAALSEREPSYAGPRWSFGDVVVDPHAVQPSVPLWIGGRSRRSLRRAVELGDGWVPFGLGARDLAAMLAEHDLPDDFAVVLSTGPLDPEGDAERVLARIARLREVGATRLGVQLVADSVRHWCEQLHALRELVPLDDDR